MRELPAAALEAWSRSLGSGYVEVAPAALAAVQTTTFATAQRVVAVLRPGDRSEVQECLRIANRFGVPVYPVSRGKNWGLGSRVPVEDGCAVLDLGRLDRILEVNEELAYVTLEPGVTFRQLFEHLRQTGSRLMLSQTGSSLEASVIGNTVERGTGRGVYEERFGHVCALEVVLPGGDCIHTGFSRFPGARAAQVSHWGVGPWVDGLFTQSSLGIVTRMTLWLVPTPRDFRSLSFRLQDPARLPALVDALRLLRLDLPVRGVFSLYNDLRLLALIRQYPWEETGGETPLPEAVRQQLRKRYRLAAWNGSGALYAASAAQGRAEARLVRRVLAGKVDSLFVLDRFKARVGGWLRRPVRWVTGVDLGGFLAAGYAQSAFLGYPQGQGGVPLTYWRKRMPVPADADPDRDRCGTIWFNPAIPCRGEDARIALELIERITRAHAFEPNVGLRFIGERSIDITGAVVYDREVPGEDERAMACHDAILYALAERGYLPSRLGIHSMHALPPPDDDSDEFLTLLKRSLDPRGILAPGRYARSQPSAMNRGAECER